MAMELMFSENNHPPTKGSPRISFSHDFVQADSIIPIEHLPPSLQDASSTLDFNFPITDSCLDQDDSSSADELFSHGKLLPAAQIKKKKFPPKQTDQTHIPSPKKTTNTTPPQCDYEEIPKKGNPKEDSYETQRAKSFWGFKRSSSCGSGYGSSLCPIPLLSRSNSTGSATSVKKSSSSSLKDSSGNNNNNNGIQKQQNSSHYQKSYMGSHQKPPLKKSYGNGVHVHPVLNVHSASLFGLGSFFSNGKDKTRKK